MMIRYFYRKINIFSQSLIIYDLHVQVIIFSLFFLGRLFGLLSQSRNTKFLCRLSKSSPFISLKIIL